MEPQAELPQTASLPQFPDSALLAAAIPPRLPKFTHRVEFDEN